MLQDFGWSSASALRWREFVRQLRPSGGHTVSRPLDHTAKAVRHP